MFCPFAIDIIFYLFVNQGISVYSGVPVVLGDVKMIFEEKKITLKNGFKVIEDYGGSVIMEKNL